MQYNVKDGQNVFDVLSSIGQPIENTYAILFASGISLDDDISNGGAVINYTPVSETPVEVVALSVSSDPVRYYSVQQGQSIFDVILNTYGSLNMVYEFIRQNNLNGVMAKDYQKVVSYVSEDIYDGTVERHLISKNINYATYTEKGGGSFNGSFNKSFS